MFKMPFKRGKGLDITTKYKWIKQPNGRFTIFDVPIFKPYLTEDVKVEEADLKDSIQAFELKKEGGYYPSIHLQHQELTDNSECQHLGFLDNIHLDEESVMIADLVELDEETLQDIQNLKRAYRSLEFNPQKNEIVSLALMTSKPPHYKFPLLALKDEAEDDIYNLNFASHKRVLQFKERNKDFVFEGENMDPIEGEEKKEKVEAPEEFDVKDSILEMLKQAAETNSLLKSLIEKFEVQAKEENEDVEKEEDKKDKVEGKAKLNSETPSSIAMKEMNSLILQMKEEMRSIKEDKAVSQFSEQLKQICNENPGIDYASHEKQLLQFSGDDNKKRFLDHVKVTALQFSSNTPGRLLAGVPANLPNKKDVTAQFSDRSALVQATARQAVIDYRDTCNQLNANAVDRFKKTWKSEEDYVKAQVNLCEIND